MNEKDYILSSIDVKLNSESHYNEIKDGLYCGIIIKSEWQECEKNGEIEWRRLLLHVDIAKGVYKGYFSKKYDSSSKDGWGGVMSIYCPVKSPCSDNSDEWQRWSDNISILLSYNNIDIDNNSATALEGLLVPIDVKHDHIGCVKIGSYFCSYNYQVDTTFADNDLTHYYDQNKIIYNGKLDLSAVLPSVTVNEKDIRPSSGLAARRKHYLDISNSSLSSSFTITSSDYRDVKEKIRTWEKWTDNERCAWNELNIVDKISAVINTFGQDKSRELYKRFMLRNYLPNIYDPIAFSASVYKKLDLHNKEWNDICFQFLAGGVSIDEVALYGDIPYNEHEEYDSFEKIVINLVCSADGRYARLYKLLRVYYIDYFACRIFENIAKNNYDMIRKSNNTDFLDGINFAHFISICQDKLSLSGPYQSLNSVDINIPIKEFLSNHTLLVYDKKQNRLRLLTFLEDLLIKKLYSKNEIGIYVYDGGE